MNQWSRRQLLAHETELEAVYERLADSKSRRVFCDILDYKLSGKLTYLEGVSRRWDDLLTLFPGPTGNAMWILAPITAIHCGSSLPLRMVNMSIWMP